MLGGRRSLTTGPDRLVWCFSNELGLLLYTYQHSQTGKQASRQAVANRRSDQTKPNQPTNHTLRQTRKQPATVCTQGRQQRNANAIQFLSPPKKERQNNQREK